jgi:carboxylesterase type B
MPIGTQGIPYAKAERWKRPVPRESWAEPLKTWEFGTRFPQGPGRLEDLYAAEPGGFSRNWISFSEDSHFLNVFAPQGTRLGDDLPVLVWIQ